MERGVSWTSEMRTKVWSWRGHVNPEFEREYVELSRNVEEGFEKRLQYMRNDSHLRPFFEAGRARVQTSERPMMEAALAARDEKKMPAKLDQDIEVALIALEIQHIFSAMPFWIAKEGLEFAMRTLARCHAYHSSGKDEGYSIRGVWVVRAPDEAGSYPEYADSGWQLLRALLATADDATYASMRAVAEELRANAPPVIQAFIAIAFATESAWAEDAAEAVLGEKYPSGWAKALVTVASVDMAARLARNKFWSLAEDEILTLLAREGSDAVPVLAAALEASGNNEERKRYANLLARIETEDAAAAFVPWIANKTINPIATKYYKRLPDITRRALEPIAQSKDPSARAVTIILASLS